MKKLTTKNKGQWVLPLALLLIALACFAPWYLRLYALYTPPGFETLRSEDGVWDFSGHDYGTGFTRANGYVEYIPGEHLTPDEFARREGEALTGHPVDDAVNTARLTILVPDDSIYMLATNSVDFSERIYINGVLRQQAGNPGLTADTSTPGFAMMYFEVQPQDGVITIVRQTANFVHRSNSGASGVYVGRPQQIKRHLALQTDLSAFTMGLYFALFLAHGLLFLVLRSYRANLYFALLCLTWGARTAVTGVKVLTAWFPGLSWYFTFRLEYLTAPVAALLMILVIRQIFTGLLPKWFVWGAGGACALYAVCCLLVPTLPLSHTIVGFEVFYIAAVVFVFAVVALRVPRMARAGAMRTEHWVTLAGLALFFLATVHDAFYYNNIYLLGINQLLNDLTLLVFSFFQMAAMFYATMRQLSEARQAERRMADEKEMMAELARRRSVFYADVSHELKTPLTVIAANAQYAAKQIAAGTVDSETVADLDAISGEAKRLAQMVSGLVGLERVQDGGGRVPLALDALVGDTARMYKSLADKQGNTLAVAVAPAPDLPAVLGNADQLTQVILNLLSNANRHTQNGTITVEVRGAGGFARVTVSDTGEGIPPGLLPDVFERFSRGQEDGAGLGLPICKTIVEAHGGEIGIESEAGRGTMVWFTLPIEN